MGMDSRRLRYGLQWIENERVVLSERAGREGTGSDADTVGTFPRRLPGEGMTAKRPITSCSSSWATAG
jgi:hypothetical protein